MQHTSIVRHRVSVSMDFLCFVLCFFHVICFLQQDLDAAGFVCLFTVFMPCCFGCSRALFSAFSLPFFCILDSYTYWLGVVSFACTFSHLFTVYLASLVRSFVSWYLTVFSMRVNNCVSCKLRHSHVLFLCPPVASYSTTVRPSKLLVGPHTPQALCVCCCCVCCSGCDRDQGCAGSAQVCLPALLGCICVCQGFVMVGYTLELTHNQGSTSFVSYLTLHNFFPLLNYDFA